MIHCVVMSEGHSLLMVCPAQTAVQKLFVRRGVRGPGVGTPGPAASVASGFVISRLIRSDRGQARHRAIVNIKISPDLANTFVTKMLHHRAAADANCPLCIE